MDFVFQTYFLARVIKKQYLCSEFKTHAVMKKFIFTLLLAIVSSVWTMSGALCLGPIPNAMYQPFTTVSGTFVSVPIPCEPSDDYPCPSCLTLALQTSDRLYYLTADNADIQTQLEAIEYQLSEAADITGSVSGTPYTEESYEYIRVQAVDTNPAPMRLPSLCDEWNVWYESFESYGPVNFNQLIKYRLTTDTIINEIRYVKLVSNNDYPYCGALREGDNRDIYYIPVDSSHEYLLYAFNAKVGDMLTNLYIGGFGEESGHSGVVESISDDSPRVFTIRVNTPADGIESGDTFLVRWIEGVGSPETPCGMAVVPYVPTDIGVYTLLCAYNNGEQVYISEAGQKYGCEYNGEEQPHLKSLCDEWNIMAFKADGRGYYWYSTLHYQLTTDTIISARQYVKLQEQKRYVGAMREGENEDIYYVPADSTHEYLLYAFNPRAGEPLENLWIGQRRKYYSNIGDITASKSSSDPRFIAVDIPYGENHEYHHQFIWVQGVGAQFGVCFDNEYETKVGLVLLCAYKNGEQVFVSNNWGDKYGCEAYKDSIPSDTIPLYVKDNPGSSTVDPADPNLIYAVLEGDMLIIKDFTGAEIIFTLTNNGSMHSPARARRTQSLSFTDSTSVELTENGLYDIELTSEAWDYMVFGSFDFNKIHEAVERIQEEHPTPTKILRNGQLLFRHGNHLYTITGIQIQ